MQEDNFETKSFTLSDELCQAIHAAQGDTSVQLSPSSKNLFPITSEIKKEAEEKKKRDTERYLNPVIGEEMPDGTIFLGSFNDKDWYVTGQDAKDSNGNNLLLAFNKASSYAKKLDIHGHNDWQLPPGGDEPNEPSLIREMFKHRHTGKFKGTYKEEKGRNCWYTSSTRHSADDMYRYIYQRRFDEEQGCWYINTNPTNIRCIRAVTRPKP